MIYRYTIRPRHWKLEFGGDRPQDQPLTSIPKQLRPLSLMRRIYEVRVLLRPLDPTGLRISVVDDVVDMTLFSPKMGFSAH